MKKVPENAIYLGAPLFTSRSRSKDFKYLQEKLEARLNGWRSKSLSWAGRCTLIKSVTQAIPAYTFFTFDVPIGVCDKLDFITRRFWWNPKKNSGRFLAWKSWDHLCNSKNSGGLGFRKAKDFNEALIAKITWMIASNRNTPCMVALRSKYKGNENWLREEPRKFASNSWKAVESMKKLITKGACFLIGDGNSIDVWKVPWVPWIHGFIPKPRTPSLAYLPISVAELIDPTTNSWIDAKLSELFDDESITAIKRIVLPSAPRPNKLIWILNPKGNFTVKSAIRANQVNVDEASNEYWKKIWKLKIHDRYKLLVWRIATGILPTKLNIAHKMGITDTCCPLCHMNEESIEHLFFQCSISRAIWFGTSWAIHSSRLSLASCQDILKLICEPPIFTAAESSKAKDILLQTSIQFAITLDCIWNLRNQVVFEDLQVNLLVQIKNLETRIMEHINALEDPSEFGLNKPYSAKYWTAPPPGSMKLNVDD